MVLAEVNIHWKKVNHTDRWEDRVALGEWMLILLLFFDMISFPLCGYWCSRGRNLWLQKMLGLMGESHWSLTSCNHQLNSWQSWPGGKNWCGIMTQLILLQNCPNQPSQFKHHICVTVSCSEAINEIGFNFSWCIITVDICLIENITELNYF